MTLSILTTRCKGELDSVLIEDVTLLSYDLIDLYIDDWMNMSSSLIKWNRGFEPVGRLDWIRVDLGVEE